MKSKIKRVRAVQADLALFAVVETEDGRVGVGEAGVWGHIEAAAGALGKFAQYLEGEDAEVIEHHWNVMHRFSHYRGAAIMGAISALWDLKGQRLGEPIHALLGGPVNAPTSLKNARPSGCSRTV